MKRISTSGILFLMHILHISSNHSQVVKYMKYMTQFILDTYINRISHVTQRLAWYGTWQELIVMFKQNLRLL